MSRFRHRRDPVERTEAYKRVVDEVEAKVHAEFGEAWRHRMGYCHFFWHRKQEILQTEHNIVLRSPAEMNPGILYD